MSSSQPSLAPSSSSAIQSSLEEIDKSLKDVQDRREKLIKGTRDVVMLCSKSIVAMHHNQLEDAKSKMDQAKTMLEEFREYARQDLYRYIAVAEQELVEAYALKSVMEDKPMPSMSELEVARMLIEDIRATVTEENRRKALIEAVGGFERRMSSD